MKYSLKVLIICLFLVFTINTSHAIDFGAKGWYWMSFDYANGGNFMSKNRQGKNVTGSRMQGSHVAQDEFEALTRVLIKLDATVNENLSGVLTFKIGNHIWGEGSSGGALGTDGMIVRVNEAYIDWTVPKTKLKLRMGLQNTVLPSFTFESNVLIDGSAGIIASYNFDENVSLTALWTRPYNDNSYNNYVDNIDLFGLVLPLTFEKVQITPWILGGIIGSNTLKLKSDNNKILTDPVVVNDKAPQTWGQVTNGLLSAAFSTNNFNNNKNYYSSVWWVGVTGKLNNIFDTQLQFMWDVNYGSLDDKKEYLKRSGWIGNAILEYKFDMVTPGLYGWYSSGDDNDTSNGSEKMPFLSQMNIGPNTVSSFGFKASPWVNNEGVLGGNTVGTWGVGVRLKDLTFIENINHVIRFNYFGGMNDPNMADYITGRKTEDNGNSVYRRWTDFNSNYGVYLTNMDTGIEVNIDTVFTIYDNFQILLELGYIHLNLSDNVWGKYENLAGNTLNYKDAYKVSVGFMYNF